MTSDAINRVPEEPNMTFGPIPGYQSPVTHHIRPPPSIRYAPTRKRAQYRKLDFCPKTRPPPCPTTMPRKSCTRDRKIFCLLFFFVMAWENKQYHFAICFDGCASFRASEVFSEIFFQFRRKGPLKSLEMVNLPILF
jgi:hypothetical protein